MSKNDLTLTELKQLISTITFFQLGARTKELKTIKLKLKNQLNPLCKSFVDFGNYSSENIELD